MEYIHNSIHPELIRENIKEFYLNNDTIRALASFRHSFKSTNLNSIKSADYQYNYQLPLIQLEDTQLNPIEITKRNRNRLLREKINI